MKKCPNCGKQYPDNINFCTACGAPLQMEEVQTKTKGNGALIAIIACLGVAIVAAVVVIIIMLNSGGSSDPGSPMTTSDSVAEATEVPDDSDDRSPSVGGGAGGSSGGQIGDGSSGSSGSSGTTADDPVDEPTDGMTDNPQATNQPILSEYNFAAYREYYESCETTFDELIMTDSEQSDYTNYHYALGIAIDEMDGEACETNYQRLKTLEETATEYSINTLENTISKLNKLKKKSSSKKAMKKAAFIKAETRADIAARGDQYKTANKNYKICIKKLQAAAKAAKAASSAGGDDYYKTLWQDDNTWREVYYYQLDRSYVRSMSTEQRRYYMNTLYACYGYRFSNDTIQEFFNYQSWYYPNTSYARGDQTGIRNLFDSIAEYNYKLLGGE